MTNVRGDNCEDGGRSGINNVDTLALYLHVPWTGPRSIGFPCTEFDGPGVACRGSCGVGRQTTRSIRPGVIKIKDSTIRCSLK